MSEFQRDLFYRPPPTEVRGMARNPDHSTAIDAARQIIPKRNQLQIQVLAAFEQYGAMTDEQLEDLPEFSRYTYSTVRKRRTELFQRGEIAIVGEAYNSHGSKMKVWDLTGRAKALAPGESEC